MTKFLFAIVCLFLSTGAFAAQITMYQYNAPLNTQPVERVIVRGDYVQINTMIHPCSSYPGFPDRIYGDVYSCSTNRSVLNQILGDEKMMNLSDEKLTQYIFTMDKTLHCDTAMTPSLVSYKGKNVYWFSGPLIPGAPTLIK